MSIPMGADTVAMVAQTIAQAVEITMDPSVPHEQRFEAYSTCETFKDKSPLCVQCGLYLLEQQNLSPVVRHFGLQLMEHCIKYRWYDLTQQEKIFIKESAMKLLSAGMDIQSPQHMKDALSRVVVEMVKREWPQQWPSLMSELSQVSALGESQTQLVLLVFLRLGEDVALLQTLESNQRRKDIYQALTLNMGEIFSFLVELIETQVPKFEVLHAQGRPIEQSIPHSAVVQTVLLTLTGFVDWVSITHIMKDEGRLVRDLCLLLDHSHFRLGAAECLLQIVNRKGKVEERKPLLMLFNNDSMTFIYRTAYLASTNQADEYNFLKVLTQVLTGLGMQLCVMWGKDDGVTGQPPNFAVYLDIIIVLTGHPSITVSNYVNQVWSAMFKHEHISRHPVFLERVPKWLNAAAPKLVKPNWCPSLSSTKGADTAYYASLDYDCKEDFYAFFLSCRVALLDTFRQATFVAPLVTFSYVEHWLQQRIQQSRADDTPCTLQSPAVAEWEALSNMLESVLSKILQVTERPSRSCGIQLLELCLNFETKDPLILSNRLSCISALFVFLTMAPSTALLMQVLNAIFSALVYSEPGMTRDTRTQAVRNVRRHAAYLMVKIGMKYPLILLPIFDQIHATVRDLQREELQLSRMEKVTLQESLVLINNHFYDYERQTNFIGEELKNAAIKWHDLGQKAFVSSAAFVNVVALDRPAITMNVETTAVESRSNISFCLQLLLVTVKRCTWPDDPDKAARGGFVVRVTESGNPVYRNPAEPHVIPMLPHLLALLMTFNSLWRPESRDLLSEDYKAALNMSESERNSLLGVGGCASNDVTESSVGPYDSTDLTSLNGNVGKVQSPLLKMQAFLANTHDNCYHVLGAVGPSFGWGLYQLPGLAANLINTVFSNLQHIPDYRLRSLVRTFLKPFISSCPSALYEPVLMPIFAHFFPYVLERLTAKWQHLTELREAGAIDDENPNAQEVIEDMLNRLLTREYLDVVKVALIGGSIAADPVTAIESMDQDDVTRIPLPAQNNAEVASELGQLILRNGITAQSVTLCVVRALTWDDGPCAFKASYLTGPLVRQLVSDGSMSGPLAAHVMTSLLQGLQLHGLHEMNQATLTVLGAQLYDLLRPRYPEVLEVMKQIPGINLTELQKLDEKVLGNATPSSGAANPGGRGSSKLDKAKKDNFKRLTSQLIGCNLSQLFRKKACIADLPRIQVPKRPKPPPLDDIPNVDTGLTNLFNHRNPS